MATEAAMVTERKKKFDSARKAWEEKSSSGQVVTAAADADAQLFVAPAIVKGVVEESQQFKAFDIEGKNVPADEWTISNLTPGELIRGTEPTVVFKKADVIAVRARAGAEIAPATITVSEKGPLPMATVLWAMPEIPGYRSRKFVQAVPTMHGPDLYTLEKNEAGDTFIRALFADGRQLWMKKYSHTDGGVPMRIIPH